MLIVTKLQTAIDLSDEALFQACIILGTTPSQVTIFCAFNNIDQAEKLRAAFHCKIVLFPHDMLICDEKRIPPSGYGTWAVNAGSSWVWSTGA